MYNLRTIVLLVGLAALPGIADAQQVLPNPTSPVQSVCLSGAVVGNGADTTEDTLQTCVLPAGLLASTGNRIHIFAAGSFGATGGSDAKLPKVKFGGTSVSTPNSTGTAAGKWTVDAYVVKTGASTQTFSALAGGAAGANGNNSGTLSVTDTAAITILVTGQNTSTATANSVTCQYFTVDYQP